MSTQTVAKYIPVAPAASAMSDIGEPCAKNTNPKRPRPRAALNRTIG